MKKLKIVGLLILFSSYLGYAQHRNPNSTLTINYHYNTKKTPDTLSLWSYPTGNYWESSTDYLILKKADGKFYFQFPPFVSLMHYRLNESIYERFSQIGSYFAQAGDKVVLDIYQTQKEDSLVFSGHGAEKYRLTEQLLRKEEQLRKQVKVPKTSLSTAQLRIHIDSNYRIITLAKKEKQILIDHYSNIDPAVRALIGYQYANYETLWCNYLLGIKKNLKASPEAQRLVRQKFNQYFSRFLDSSSPASLPSQRHYQLLLNMLRYRLAFNSNEDAVSIKDYYKLAKTYSEDPLIRDRLLSQFFAYDAKGSSDYNQNTFDSLAKDAAAIVKSEMAKEILASKTLFKKGSYFYDATFTDLHGHPFDTKSLRGKVFLLDGWGEGCGGCILFHNWFETNIWPKVKEIDNFVVLSVFDGKDKNSWLRGMASKKYTSDHYLNVSDMPYRLAGHPMFQHYKINYLPFLLLVDKRGRIVAKLKGITNAAEFTQLIKALSSEP